MALLEALALAIFTGSVSAAATVAAIKTDIRWMKKFLGSVHRRVKKLEEKVS